MAMYEAAKGRAITRPSGSNLREQMPNHRGTLECLTHAPQFSKLGEHELNGFADPSVGMKHNLSHLLVSDKRSKDLTHLDLVL
jgi:hypothetical protein